MGFSVLKHNTLTLCSTDCGPESYRISKMSPFKKYINTFVLRYFENGLYDKQREWQVRLSRARYQVRKHEATVKDSVHIVVDLNLISGLYAMYLVGIAVSAVVFIIELNVSIVLRLMRLKAHAVRK